MRTGRDGAGFTLMEVMFTSAILAIVMVICLAFLVQTTDVTSMDAVQTYAENQVQEAADEIVRDLKEAAPALCSFYHFPTASPVDTAICFPSARDQTGRDGNFVYTRSGEVQPYPVWQCIQVYCRAPNGKLFRFRDYTATRDYTFAITVTSVTDTTITLSDGTTFNRVGTAGANQTVRELSGIFTQVKTQGTSPVQLIVSSTVQHKATSLRGKGSTVVTTLTNEALCRNQN